MTIRFGRKGGTRNELSEKEIEDQILTWLKSQRIMAWKVKSTGTYDPTKRIFRRVSAQYRKGVSDVLGIYKGRPLAIEVKSKRGKPTPEQEAFLAEFAANGGIAMIARSVEAVEKVLNEIQQPLERAE